MYLFVGLILNLSHEKNSEHEVILDSTLITLCISLGCVFLGVLVFTRSTHLAIIVMTIVMTIVVGLLFFMVIATWLKSPKVFSLDEFSIAVIFYTEWDLYWVYSLMIIVLYILNQIWQVWQMYLVACFPSIVKRLETAQFCQFAQIMNWSIGAIEVLSLIVFVGFAVDYCLHLSQSQKITQQVALAKHEISSWNFQINGSYISELSEINSNLICWRWWLFWGRINTIPATSLTSRRRMMRKKRCQIWILQGDKLNHVYVWMLVYYDSNRSLDYDSS